jgi:concentrative nucleoside transporter, CNT family
LFVFKTAAGFSIFNWIATLAADFLHQALAGAVFFFDQDTINKGWFFINTVQSVFFIACHIDLTDMYQLTTQLASIIFFVAFIQMMYHLGAMQWILKHL